MGKALGRVARGLEEPPSRHDRDHGLAGGGGCRRRDHPSGGPGRRTRLSTTSTVEVQPHGLPKTDLGFLGWDDALPMYRPFLSYSELGSMFDEGPTKLHDAVSSVLGLDELTAAQNVLRTARLARQKQVKAALEHRDEIVAVLEGLDDERARQCVAALRGRSPALDVVEKIATAGHPVDAGGELARLRRIVGIEIPDRETVLAAATSLREAHQSVSELAGTTDDAMLRSADLLEAALAYLADYPSDDCPVCGTEGTVDSEWQIARSRAGRRAATRREDRPTRAEAPAGCGPNRSRPARQTFPPPSRMRGVSWTSSR